MEETVFIAVNGDPSEPSTSSNSSYESKAGTFEISESDHNYIKQEPKTKCHVCWEEFELDEFELHFIAAHSEKKLKPSTTIKIPPNSSASRPRGRPRKNPDATDELDPLRRPRGRPATAAIIADVDDINLSELSPEEAEKVKFRRMRDLNNAASKRCRINRKRKNEEIDNEITRETERNTLLKERLAILENDVQKLKAGILNFSKKSQEAENVSNKSEDSISSENTTSKGLRYRPELGTYVIIKKS